MDVAIATIGQNKGTARVWLQGNPLLRAGFEPKTKYEVSTKEGAIVLTKTDVGVKIREVSSRRKNDKDIPIIDINNAELATMFEGLSQVRVIFREGEINILPLASEIRAKERMEDARTRMDADLPLTFGSLAHGGGILSHALEAGFKEQGVSTELAFSNEFREDLTDHVMVHNDVWSPKTISLQGPMQEYAFDEWVMRSIGRVNVLEAGLPCSGASVAGRAKRALNHAEAHPEVGHLVVAFLAIISRVNPAVIILENVPQYQNTASMDILRNQLRDMCYDVHETTVDGADWNAMEHRKRMVMVAVTRGMPFSFDALQRPERVERKLSEILEDVPLDDPRWSRMEGLKAKEIRDKEAGKSFAMQIFDGESPKISTLTKGISKNRSTDAKIRHPENPDLLRIPTSLEHARAKDIPTALVGDLCSTTAHELLGQSIIYKPFVSVGSLIAKSFKMMKDSAPSEEAVQANLVTQAVIAKAKREAQRALRMSMN
jgi:DNA (cytosine-5)-methyltransferase 1